MSIQRARPFGITLMEVLISIFVVSIGLLGVAALIPLGGHQIEQGARNDRKANVGRRSFREFMVRGLNNPGESDDQKWLANKMSLTANRMTQKGDDIVFKDSETGEFNPNNLAYCIDPLFMAQDANRTSRGLGRAEYFPYLAKDLPGAARLAQPGWPALATGGPPVKAMQIPRISFAENGAAMVLSHAEQLCLFRDDLNFKLPEGNQQNARQTMLEDSSDNELKRDAAENYSWFATLFPRNGQWLLSTVIVRDRNFASVASGGYGLAPSYELTGTIIAREDPAPAQSGYYSLAGDVRVDWGAADSTPTSNIGDGVPVGSWVIIGHDDRSVSTAESFNWYRVVSAGELEIHTDAGTPHIYQDLMLSGPTLADANMIVGYIVGTEAVYQKTIKLDL